MITDSETKIQFMKVVEVKLAEIMNVDISMILNVTVSAGSIVVNFTLLAPEQSKSVVNLTNFILNSTISSKLF